MPDLNQTQEGICLALRALDGEAATPDIKSRIESKQDREVSTSNLGRQASGLRESGLVEVVGEKDVGAPIPANVYALTDEGAAVAEDLYDASLAPGGAIDNDDLREVRRDIDDLQTGLDQARSDIDDKAAEARIDEMEGRLKDVESTVEYHDDVVKRLDEKTTDIARQLQRLS